MRPDPATVRAAGWSLAQMWGGRAVALVSFLWIARLVEPHEIGIFVLAQVLVVAARLLTFRGLATAIVQRPEIDDEHLDVVFWSQLTLGAGIALPLAAAAAPLAAAMGRPELGQPLAALSPLLLLWSLSSVQSARLRRHLAFRDLAVRSLGANLVGGAIGVALAYRGAGVWSLVGKVLSGEAVGVLLLWGIAGWRPRLRFPLQRLRELRPFALRASAVHGLDYVVEHGDDLVVGALLGPLALGYYAAGYHLVRLLRAVAIEPVEHFTLPTFARLQSQPARLAAGLASALRWLSALAFPLFACLAVVAPELVALGLGPEWAPAAPVVQVLAVAGALRVAVAPLRSALMAMGEVGTTLRVDLTVATVSMAGFLIGARWETVGVASAHVVAGAVALPAFIVAVARRTTTGAGTLAGGIMLGLAAAALALVLGIAARAALVGFSPPVRLLAGAAAAILVYALLAGRLALSARARRATEVLHR